MKQCRTGTAQRTQTYNDNAAALTEYITREGRVFYASLSQLALWLGLEWTLLVLLLRTHLPVI